MLAVIAVELMSWLEIRRARSSYERDALVYAARTSTITGRVPGVLSESSGVAVSRARPGTLWSHNDSGWPAELVAIDLQGRVLQRVTIGGAENRDWEALDLGPCPVGAEPGDCLYVGDIGDNAARREAVVIYVVPEPEADAASVPVLKALTVTYPDGPMDAEGLAVEPDGSLLIVSKGRSGAIHLLRVAKDALSQPAVEGRAEAALIHTLEIEPDFSVGRQVTGAAVSPSGAWLAVRTYRDIYFLARSGSGWAETGARCYLWGREYQGEAVGFLDETTLVLTSESLRGNSGQITRVRCFEEATPEELE